MPRWHRVLWPLSWLYFALALARAWFYRHGIVRSRKLPGTTISIGNLSLGGTGKTPMVLWIANRLAKEGKLVGILTRGYRGSPDAENRGEPQSDEVALLRERLAGKVQFGIGKDRFARGQTLARHGVDWFVLDDGFQHLKLRRDVDIVLLDSTDPFGAGMVLPAGRLREPVSALKRADIVVITRVVDGTSPAIEAIVQRHTNGPIFYARTKIERVLRVPGLAIEMPSEQWREVRFLAFCGIGNPSSFFHDLRGWGFQLTGERSFADHHPYTAGEMAQLESAAYESGAQALLCTEKDVWNLRRSPALQLPVYCCSISFELPEEQFRRAIGETLLRKQLGKAR